MPNRHNWFVVRRAAFLISAIGRLSALAFSVNPLDPARPEPLLRVCAATGASAVFSSVDQA